MKKIAMIGMLLLITIGCSKSQPATFDKVFICDGVTFTFNKDGTAVLSYGEQSVDATYTKDGKTAYRVTFVSISGGGYMKIDGNTAGVVDNSSVTADYVDSLKMDETDSICEFVK